MQQPLLPRHTEKFVLNPFHIGLDRLCDAIFKHIPYKRGNEESGIYNKNYSAIQEAVRDVFQIGATEPSQIRERHNLVKYFFENPHFWETVDTLPISTYVDTGEGTNEKLRAYTHNLLNLESYAGGIICLADTLAGDLPEILRGLRSDIQEQTTRLQQAQQSMNPSFSIQLKFNQGENYEGILERNNEPYEITILTENLFNRQVLSADLTNGCDDIGLGISDVTLLYAVLDKSIKRELSAKLKIGRIKEVSGNLVYNQEKRALSGSVQYSLIYDAVPEEKGSIDLLINLQEYNPMRDIFKYLASENNAAVIGRLEGDINNFGRTLTDLKAISAVCHYIRHIEEERGIQFIFPEVAGEESQTDLDIEGLYHLLLINNKSNVVPNHVKTTRKSHARVITGPVKGGKTCYLELVGLAMAFFQAGLPLPLSGNTAHIRPKYNVVTYLYQEGGRPAEGESSYTQAAKNIEAFVDAAGHIRTNSLILIDEPLGVTSTEEATKTIRDLYMNYFKSIGATVFITTHNREMARALQRFGSCEALHFAYDKRRNPPQVYEIRPGIGRSHSYDLASQILSSAYLTGQAAIIVATGNGQRR